MLPARLPALLGAGVLVAVISTVGRAASAAPPDLPAPTSLAALAAALNRPVAGEPLGAAGPFRVGRGELLAAPGSVVRPLFADGTPCGLWIEGPATFRYRVEDRLSRPIARRNLARASQLTPTETAAGLAIERSLRHAVIWSWELGSAVAGIPSSTAPSFPAWASAAIERALVSPPAHELLAARREGVAGVAVALLDDRDGVLRLDVDPLQARSEVLSRLVDVPRGSALAGRLQLVELAEQPLGRAWWDRFPDALVAVHRDLVVVQDGATHVTIESATRLRATRGVSTWKAAHRSWTSDAKGRLYPIEIRSLTVDGKPADWHFDRGSLLVALPVSLPEGAEVELRAVTAGEYAQLDENNDYWVLGLSPWYPRGPLNGDLATLSLTVRVPDRWTAIASGETVRESRAEGMTELVTRFERPMQGPVVAVGNFHSLVEPTEGVRVRVASYAMKKERESRLLLQNFAAAKQYYERLLGSPYPFAELDIVERNSWSAGMAPPGLIFITREAFTPLAMLRLEGAEAALQAVNNRFVHEIAHGWWGHVVKMDAAEEGWINEGFAEYSAALCLQAMRGGGKAGEREFKSWLSRWKSYTGDLSGDSSVYLASHFAGLDDRDHTDTWILRYAKGALVLHGLRQELQRVRGSVEEGDKYFFALLRSFVKNTDVRFGSTAMLIGILGQMTGLDWQPWFERYVFGTETPPVS